MPTGPVLDPIAEQNARNAALLAETGASAPHVSNAAVLEGAPGDFGSIDELFLSQTDRGTPPGLDPDEDQRQREEEERQDLGIPKEVGNTLHLSADEVEPMELSAFDAAKRRELAEKGLGFALPDGSLPVDDKGSLKAAINLRNNYKGEHQSSVAEHLKKAAKRLGAEDMLPEQLGGPKPDPDLTLADQVKCPECGTANAKGSPKCSKCGYDLSKVGLSQEDESHAASFYDRLALAETRGKDGLIWKAICKTGTLALSPGPGQIDVEKPLELTPKLFEELKASVDEKAFPHITVPITHNNGLLDNTGYVRKVEVEDSKDPTDPAGTKVLMAGIEFTEPGIKEKVINGTIPDTSVGVKFNYRNKRTGKLFAAALEHVALTHQPWVDGLTPFGQALSQEGIFDQAEERPDWDGVYIHAAQPESEEVPAKDGPSRDILPGDDHSGTVPGVGDTPKPGAGTVERLMAAQQAETERLAQENEKLRRDLALAQGIGNDNAEKLHASAVGSRIKALEGKVPPSLLTRIEAIYLADKPTSESTLQLSLAGAGDEGKDLELGSATELVEFLLSALPIADNGDVASLVLNLSAEATRRPEEKSAGEKAESIMTDAGLSEPKPASGEGE